MHCLFVCLFVCGFSETGRNNIRPTLGPEVAVTLGSLKSRVTSAHEKMYKAKFWCRAYGKKLSGLGVC